MNRQLRMESLEKRVVMAASLIGGADDSIAPRRSDDAVVESVPVIESGEPIRYDYVRDFTRENTRPNLDRDARSLSTRNIQALSLESKTTEKVFREWTAASADSDAPTFVSLAPKKPLTENDSLGETDGRSGLLLAFNSLSIDVANDATRSSDELDDDSIKLLPALSSSPSKPAVNKTQQPWELDDATIRRVDAISQGRVPSSDVQHQAKSEDTHADGGLIALACAALPTSALVTRFAESAISIRGDMGHLCSFQIAVDAGYEQVASIASTDDASQGEDISTSRSASMFLPVCIIVVGMIAYTEFAKDRSLGFRPVSKNRVPRLEA